MNCIASITISKVDNIEVYHRIDFCFNNRSLWPSHPYNSWTFVRTSVTRFGKILPLWLNLKDVGHFFRFFAFAESFSLFWPIFLFLGKFSLLQMAKYWTNNLTIWSHWSELKLAKFRRLRKNRILALHENIQNIILKDFLPLLIKIPDFWAPICDGLSRFLQNAL